MICSLKKRLQKKKKNKILSNLDSLNSNKYLDAIDNAIRFKLYEAVTKLENKSRRINYARYGKAIIDSLIFM